MNIENIPTPETDAVNLEKYEAAYYGYMAMFNKSKDLERRLAVANRFICDLADQKLSDEMDDGLKDAADYSGAYESIVTEARTLKQTAP